MDERRTAPPAIGWDDSAVVAVDQRRLPHEVRTLRLKTVDELIAAIHGLAIRGAPALGIAGALGVALSAHQNALPEAVCWNALRIAAARPTAVNLKRGVDRALAACPEGAHAVLAVALTMIEEDEGVNRRAARRAADFLLRALPDRPLRIMTHCNTGRLATGGWGTALGAVRDLAERGAVELVVATETRPLLQGARLTTWELREAGIPHRLCVDSAAAGLIASGTVDCVVVGADRIAANGDVANKVGTYGLALAANRHQLPFVVVAPESTVDSSIPHGGHIVIEERTADEVVNIGGNPIAPAGTQAFNPAFDITPADLISAVMTEERDLLTPIADPGRSLSASITGRGERTGEWT